MNRRAVESIVDDARYAARWMAGWRKRVFHGMLHE